ncbi:flavonol synthase/flavanone 3-hydroxylase-like [Iris pallida]|uniref:Flavonol synthase/flavanone 3-hydroxylase-like n=1 Tax=Iris pallida TaxID=29817 RepID=A0AAX6HLZ3_IRIPA|nr:flavonol synthase/flavanone 3-hydroxylase-like [Iris pallida]
MGLGTVDSAFIQDVEHRPKPTISDAGDIPLIDLSPLLAAPTPSGAHEEVPPAGLSGLVEEVEAACRDWGFFRVTNHGVPTGLLERIQLAAREFFALPSEEKRRVARDEENPLGYYDSEHTKNVRDWKEVFDFTVEEPATIPSSSDPGDERLQEIKNQWPEYPHEFSEACKEYAKGVEILAYKLLELIALSLKLPPKRFNDFFKDSTSFVRLNHYPPCPAPHLALGVTRHKDAVALTILAQDQVGGLDVKRKSDGEWVRVNPIPYSYIINVGDIVQVWSNDRYESVEHRVCVNSEKERFSIPFFFNPSHHTMVKPLEELVSAEDPAKYHEYNWGKFFKTKRSSNFRKLAVENIQIYHFRKTQ